MSRTSLTSRSLFALLVAACLCLFASSSNADAAGAKWKIELSSAPTYFEPAGGTLSGLPEYVVMLRNVGSAPPSGPFTVTDTLPAGIVSAKTGLQTVTLTPEDFPGITPENYANAFQPGLSLASRIPVEVSGLTEGATVTNTVKVVGGAPEAEDTTTTTISSTPPAFDMLRLGVGFNDEDGNPVSQAAAHPDQVTAEATFPVISTGGTGGFGLLYGAEGGLRDFKLAFPRGLVVNPTVTPVRCTQAQLSAEETECPAGSQVGTIDVTTTVAADQFVGPTTSPLFNMVPPAGVPAEFGFNVEGLGLYGQIDGGLRGGDYTLVSNTTDIIQKRGAPVMGIRAVLWGDPTSPSHDFIRGLCLETAGSTARCPTARVNRPFLTMPSSCGMPHSIEAEADSWDHPGQFRRKEAPVTGLDGAATQVTGCESLTFSPALRARPTTEQTESPSGLEVDLKIPQSEELGLLGTPPLRKAEVTLPEGFVVNPSSANGLSGCSSAQIGINPDNGVANEAEPTCPSASRIGSAQVETPLLEKQLPGSVYIATPDDNPFHSLLAIYLVIDDPASGTLIKLPGHVVPDLQTGRLTATFDNNPQLPFSDLKIDLKSGAQGVLRTPATCGPSSTTAEMTPWSAPGSGPAATPHDDYAFTQSPTGSCAAGQGDLPNAPSFDAGSTSSLAGAYTPFVLNLRRNDGTQQFSTITVTPPRGLLARLAGTPYCSDGQLAAAASKTGTAEGASPSCPLASQIGTVKVGAGAGPSPYFTDGKVYLAGPYRGAPLSLAIITPAVAGPFDLGTVVVRSALEVDPETTQITAVSDPIPQILKGIPLDVRQIALKLDKPSFTLNPTSCDRFGVDGVATSVFNQAASLNSPFQVGGCSSLPFKPRLSLKLLGPAKRTSHPRLLADLTAKPGEANIAQTQVKLPNAAFLDQGHIKTICTRVQFAVDTCPPGSIYGKASAKTPLLDYSVSGPVYLRSSNHPLPDLVVKLKGPESQPIEVDLVGRTDSVKGALRNTFEAVPDVPVTRFHLELFGGKRGLVVLSRNICSKTYRATVQMDGQNGKVFDTAPKVRTSCKTGPGRGGRRGHR